MSPIPRAAGTVRATGEERRLDVVGLLALLVAVKAIFVVGMADVFFYGEELEKGTAAKALVDGIGLPYHELIYHYYEGGGFVVSHLKALAFLLVGENILAHKLVGIATCCLVFLAGFVLTRRHFGERAARWFGFLYVFGPASFQKLSILSLGIHFEACFFLLIVLDRGMRIAFAKERASTRRADLVVLGLAAGFGTYFSYQTVLAVGFVGVLLLWRRRDVVFGPFGALGLGAFLVGLAPFLAMAAAVGEGVLDIHGTSLTQRGQNAHRIAIFLSAVFFERSRFEALLSAAYPLTFLAAVGWGLASEGHRPRFRVLSAFAGLWLVVYAFSGFVVAEVHSDFSMMRFAPLFVLWAVLVAAALAELASSRLRLARAVGLLVIGAGVVSAVGIVDDGAAPEWSANLSKLRSIKGYNYAGYFAKLVPRLESSGSTDRIGALLEFDESAPDLLRGDFAAVAFSRSAATPAEVVEQLRELDPDGLAGFGRGLGGYWLRQARGDLARIGSLTGDLDPAIASCVWEAIGRIGTDYAIQPAAVEAEIQRRSGEVPEGYLHGIGYRAFRWFVMTPYGGQGFLLRPEAARAFLEALTPEVAGPALAGFDDAHAQYLLP